MSIHSKILVHWTGGKDIEKRPEEEKAQLYIERLKDYYQNGLFLKRTTEAVTRGWKIKNLARICFTEIRLSQAQTHAGRYGKLGIGFTRDFIMDKGGRPVIYIPFHKKDDGCLLEKGIDNAFRKSSGTIHRSIMWIMAHVKRMSNGKTEDYFQEMEWRLVYDENPANKYFTKGATEGIFRLKFTPNDIKVIIFPDGDLKQKALINETIRAYFIQHIPILATLDDCSDF